MGNRRGPILDLSQIDCAMASDKEEALSTGKPPVIVSAEVKKPPKKEPINRSKLGPDYIAPDGGHGWFVALAAGCSNVSI